MNPPTIRHLIRHEEDSSRQFKEDVTNADSLAAESLSAPSDISRSIRNPSHE